MIIFGQATGEDFSIEPAESRRPFRALLDVGLLRTTTGNRVFGALKVFSLPIFFLVLVLIYGRGMEVDFSVCYVEWKPFEI